MRIKAIVTGTGRCGTMYASRYLTQKGLSCSHEGVFNFESSETVWMRATGGLPTTESGISRKRKAIMGKRVADASYMAMPYLDDPRLSEIPILHLVRHPLDVISSFVLDLGYFGGEKPDDYNDIWEKWREEHWESPNINPASNAAHYYIFWNNEIEKRSKVYKRIRIEDGIDDETLKFLGCVGSPGRAILHDNSFRYRRKRKPIQWEEIQESIRKELIELSKKYGYPTKSF